jgi:hypothetical protein
MQEETHVAKPCRRAVHGTWALALIIAERSRWRTARVRPHIARPLATSAEDRVAPRSLSLLGEEDSRWRSVNVRVRHYLNNIVEQDLAPEPAATRGTLRKRLPIRSPRG